MGYNVKIIKDSITFFGQRLTTMEVTFPRFILAEFNTHRMFSRNSASSRAIPVEKQLAKVKSDPFLPVHWGKNQKGMQAEVELSTIEQHYARKDWLLARDQAVASAEQLLAIGVHKQITNRLLEPFMWHTALVSATEWNNFYRLRTHPDAQPEMQTIAKMMLEAHKASMPKVLRTGEWHLPLIDDEEIEAMRPPGWEDDTALKVSAGRCARVSYLTHDGKRDPQADVELANRLQAAGHMSPFEHVAQACEDPQGWANFHGWRQFRYFLPNESGAGGEQLLPKLFVNPGGFVST